MKHLAISHNRCCGAFLFVFHSTTVSPRCNLEGFPSSARRTNMFLIWQSSRRWRVVCKQSHRKTRESCQRLGQACDRSVEELREPHARAGTDASQYTRTAGGGLTHHNSFRLPSESRGATLGSGGTKRTLAKQQQGSESCGSFASEGCGSFASMCPSLYI